MANVSYLTVMSGEIFNDVFKAFRALGRNELEREAKSHPGC